jgi:mRNA interferase MazF
MLKGDIILIPFPFTDLTGNKLRPALILAQTNIDLTVAFITTQLQWQEPTDILLQPGASNGIKKASVVRISKIATIDKQLAIGKIGAINNIQIAELNLKLKTVFQIP